MKVAVYGGSFSPVHIGHLAVAEGVLKAGLADEVWMMPCRQNPLKEGSMPWPDEKRVEMIEEAVGSIPDNEIRNRIKVSRIELEMPSPSYTYITFKKLTGLFPGIKFRLLVGADSYINFKEWYNWKWLENHLDPIVYPRPGFPLADLRSGWTLLEGVKEIDVSSSRIRKMMEDGLEIKTFMPWCKK